MKAFIEIIITIIGFVTLCIIRKYSGFEESVLMGIAMILAFLYINNNSKEDANKS